MIAAIIAHIVDFARRRAALVVIVVLALALADNRPGLTVRLDFPEAPARAE